MPLVEMKDFNALIYNKLFLDQPVTNKQEAYGKLIEISRNNNYTTGNVLYYLYHQKYFKLIGGDLSRETNTSILQQINFVGRLHEDEDLVSNFGEVNRLFILVYSSQDKILKGLKLKDIIYQKKLLIIITSSSIEKTFKTKEFIQICKTKIKSK